MKKRKINKMRINREMVIQINLQKKSKKIKNDFLDLIANL